jgi:hypothetical protein
MKDTQTRQLNMGTTTLQGLDDSPAVWTGNVTATGKRDQLEETLNSIHEAAETQQITSTGGEADNKAGKKHDMATRAEIVGQGVCGYALLNNELTALNKFHVSAVGIEGMSGADAIDYCNLLYDFANTNVLALADYNITAPMLTAFSNSISNFNAVVEDPAETEGFHHSATLNLAASLATMRQILHWFDFFVGTLRLTNTTFYQAYHNWRKTDDIGVRHVSIRGLVTDSALNVPLYRAKITITNLPTPKIVYSGKTGKFRHFSLDPGIYHLTVELPGFQTQTFNNVGVVEGKITTLHISLVQA